MNDKIREHLKTNLIDGALTDDEMVELSDLLDTASDDRTPYDRQRFRDLVKKAMDHDVEPPADPKTTGFANVRLRGLRPAAAAVNYYAELQADAIDERDGTAAEKAAEFQAVMDAVQMVHHGRYFNAEKVAIGCDRRGWIGFVAAGKRMVRSADLFETSDLAGEWCQSSIDRFGCHQ